MKPLAIDLYCGLGGWPEGFLSEGWDVVGFDIEQHAYGQHRYPAQLVIQDVLTLHGSQFRNASCIVGSPPCQAYSYMAMPWSRAKREIAWQRWFRDSGSPFADRFSLNDLFDACFRIQREASEAAGRHIPLVVENVKGAQPWVGRAAWHFGSFYLWGDVPAVMPSIPHRNVPGFNFHAHENGIAGGSFQIAVVKVSSESGRRTDIGNGARFTSRDCGIEAQGVKQQGSGPKWWDEALDERRKEATKCGKDWFGPGENCSLPRQHHSRSNSRKAASALIAKIPFELSSYIARYYRP